ALRDEELSCLPEKYRAPLVLCYLQGKTNEEAASELGRPAGSMSRLLARARELLGERLTRRGVALSAGVLAAAAEEGAAAVPAPLKEATPRAAPALAAGEGPGCVAPARPP